MPGTIIHHTFSFLTNMNKRSKFIFLLFLSVGIIVKVANAQGLVHPGLLQSREDFARIKAGIANKWEPMYAGYLLFKDHPQSQFDYQLQGPMTMVGRNPTVGQAIYDADANAAYQNAIMWAVTGERRHAEKAIEIINAWCSTLKSITGRDAVLMAGLGPFKMLNAAEVIRYTNAGWKATDIAQAESHFLKVIYPVIKDMAPFANGNWDSAALKTILAIAVFCNDQQIFEQGLVYYRNGPGDGSLPNYIINETGQCQESGRDQGHAQLGIAHLADCSEIAWHQGLDLYGLLNNRLLKGFEYTAKYNLGYEVPYVPALDKTGKYFHAKISEVDRGKIRAVYEEVYNHFQNRLGNASPFTEQAAARIRPEKQGLPGADHVGFGTFLYTRKRGTLELSGSLAAPGGLSAVASGKSIGLSWVPVINASSYSIMRAEGLNAPFKVIASAIPNADFTDKNIKPGKLYLYTVSASRGKREGPHSSTLSVSAGLPSGWIAANYPEVNTGTVTFNGQTYAIEGVGKGFDGGNSRFNSISRPFSGDGMITARFVPQFNSQLTGFGLTMKDTTNKDAEHLTLLVSPQATGLVEAPGWTVRLITTSTSRSQPQNHFTSPPLVDPLVTFGRLTGYCWIRLERKGNTISGAYSTDGKEWVSAGKFEAGYGKNIYAGLLAYSGYDQLSTNVRFDHVDIRQDQSK